MTPVLIAATVWLHIGLGPPLAIAVDVLAITVAAIWSRRSLGFVLLFIVLAQVGVNLSTHQELRSIAREFKTEQVTLLATADGGAITKVRILAMPTCRSCEGAIGQYGGPLNADQTITGRLMLRPTFGYGEFVARGRGFISEPRASVVAAIHQAFSKHLSGLTPESRALVAGLSIGDTSGLSKEFSDQLKVLSLTHLNAVSGANCAIVVGLVFYVLGFVTRRRGLRIFVALCLLAGYVELVGAGASVIRAAIMAAIVLLAFSRGVWPLGALCNTASVMLIFQPNFATDYGFALSVFATAGILVLAPALHELLSAKLPAWLSLALSVTVAAQLWCMPILLGLQGGVPTYAVLANLLAEPVVAPITILGIVAAAICVPLPTVAHLLIWFASIPAQWIVAVTKTLSSLPNVTLGWHTGLVGMLALVIGLTLWLTRSKLFGAGLLVVVLLTEIIWSGVGAVRSSSWLPTDWSIVNCDVGQGDGLVIRDSGQVAVVDVGREDKPIDACLSRLGVRQIDLLVLTHYDADHIGGLAGALRGRVVDTALITPYPDTRPLVYKVAGLLLHVRHVLKAGIGLAGQLGSIPWQVLSPTQTAAEAQDSNDGSIVMRWESKDWVLYTMADLGERGQMRMVERFGGYLNHPTNKRLILKVAHHGSADQYPELIEAMHPDLALLSVGLGNSYGHPTQRTLSVLKSVGSTILRTDLQGALAVYGNLRYAVSGGG